RRLLGGWRPFRRRRGDGELVGEGHKGPKGPKGRRRTPARPASLLLSFRVLYVLYVLLVLWYSVGLSVPDRVAAAVAAPVGRVVMAGQIAEVAQVVGGHELAGVDD